MPEGVKPLYLVERRTAGEGAAAGRLHIAHGGRACQAAAQHVLAVGVTRDKNAIGPEQVQGAASAQVQLFKQTLKMRQPDGAHRHPGQLALGIIKSAAHGQAEQAAQARTHRRAHIQARVGTALKHLEVIAIGKVGFAGHRAFGIHHHIASRVQHQNGADALHAQRVVEQCKVAHGQRQGHHARVGHALHHPLQRLVKRLHRAGDAAVERAHQVGVGALGVVPCLFAQHPDAAGKQPANAQGQQQGQQDQTGSGRQAHKQQGK